MINISQDDFNKIMTLLLLVFFMVMYSISFITNRPLNITGMLGFLLPIITHSGHLFTNFLNSKTSVQAASSNVNASQVAAIKEVVTGSGQSTSQIQTNGVH